MYFDFAADQFETLHAFGNSALVDAGLGVEFQADALRRFDAALLADFGDVVGAEPFEAAGDGAAHQQESGGRGDGAAEEGASAEPTRCLHALRGGLQVVPQHFGLLERLRMFGALRAPFAQGAGVGDSGAAGGQQDQPVVGFAVQVVGHRGFGRGQSKDVQTRRFSTN